MADAGITTENLTSASIVDTLIGNRGGSTVQITPEAIGAQIAVSADIIAATAEAIASAAAAAADATAAAVSAVTAETAAANAQSSARTFATWAALSALSGAADGEGAEVLDSDTGTHLAASSTGYDGVSVSNGGRYSWSSSWLRWVRIGATGLSAKADTSLVRDVSASGGPAWALLVDRATNRPRRMPLSIGNDGMLTVVDVQTTSGVKLSQAGATDSPLIMSRSTFGFWPRAVANDAPTLALVQDSATPSGTTLVSWNDVSSWRTFGGFTSQYGANPFLQWKCRSPTGNTTGWTASAQGAGGQGFETIFTGTVLKVKLRGNGSSVRVLVGSAMGTDYAYASETILHPSSDGLQWILTITFASSATRRINIEGTNLQFGGLWVASGDSVKKPSGTKPLVCCLGTSVTEAWNSWAHWLGYRLGFDVYNVGVGACGIFADSGGTRSVQIDRSNDFTIGDFALGVDENGINDDNASYFSAYDYATVLAEFMPAYRQVVEAWFTAHPDSPFIGWGPFWPNATPTETLYAIRDAKQRVLSEYPLGRFVDTLTPSMMQGKRQDSTFPALDYIQSDNTHPNETGQRFIGLRLADAVAAVIREI